MAVETDSDRASFFDEEEWGAVASYTKAGGVAQDITGFFEAAHASVDFGGGVASNGTSPFFLCRTIDLPAGASEGDSVSVGGVGYRAKEFRPDGTGMTRIDLTKLEQS